MADKKTHDSIKMNILEFQKWCSDNMYEVKICFRSDSQRVVNGNVTSSYMLVFDSIAVGVNPNTIMMRNNRGDYFSFRKVKYIQIYNRHDCYGFDINVICGNFHDDAHDIEYNISATCS